MAAPQRPVAVAPVPHGIDVNTVTRVSAGLPGTTAAVTAAQARQANQRLVDGVLARPHVTTNVVLDTPFLLWQLPTPRLGWDPQVEPGKTRTTLHVDVNDAGASGFAKTIFYFLWSNPSDFAAVVNVHTSLEILGAILLVADNGILNEETTSAVVTTGVDILRWSGWGPDPVTGAATDETPIPFPQPAQYHDISHMGVRGFHFTSNSTSQKFPGQATNLSASLVAIPAHTVTMFEVFVLVQWSLTGHGSPNRVLADFSTTGAGFLCPGLTLEVLTPTGAAGTTATGTIHGGVNATSQQHL